ncbi:ceramide glucosyltransferase [Fusarium albosuccineum]|uniref:Ceramide glucosyltransferase n=1 Tax=Fusarium albosuccineum TaxID=1237068 RepID=A0A8H4LIY3_9HYPO|nr:ceramide glucosyltransferase [Fusarium albosuccineum]
MYSWKEIFATFFLGFSVVVVVVISIGVRSLFRNYKRRPAPPVSPNLGQNAPHVTIIRPVKGLEPRLYDCIAASFRQEYPQDKVSIRLCLEDDSDPAYPILQKVIDDFPTIDARILLEREDSVLKDTVNMGPNPKIRNLSRAYREAKGDIIWVVDCNVWMAKSVMARMVDKLMGYKVGGGSSPYKFVHQLPIVVDLIDYSRPLAADGQALLASSSEEGFADDPIADEDSEVPKVWSQGGGRLDEMFMASSHAKFYSAINTVGVAPCAVGKSNMFRKSQLDQATDPILNPALPQDQNLPTGVDYFSYNICEDHMIGDLLWNTDFPGYKKHGLVWGDLCVQPMSVMSVVSYIARRSRWLRARKFTVLSATLAEPFTESFMFATYFSSAITTLPYFQDVWGIPQTWKAMGVTWLICVTLWMLEDWFTYRRLHCGITIETDEHTPCFAKGYASREGLPRRKFLEWLAAWIGREGLAFPIWVWAVLCGSTVNWRGKSFYIRWDTTVVPVDEEERTRDVRTPELERGSSRNKRRVD